MNEFSMHGYITADIFSQFFKTKIFQYIFTVVSKSNQVLSRGISVILRSSMQDNSSSAIEYEDDAEAAPFTGNNATIRAGELLDKYGNSILRIAYSYLHNMSDAEDILQDTLIQYIRKTPVFENEKHEKAWLLTVAANLSKNRIEYLNIRKADELSEELVAEKKEDLAFVWDAVKQLPEKYREVVHLFYQEGYSTKDIAAILKRKEATVRSDLNRARGQLKNILKEAYDFE